MVKKMSSHGWNNNLLLHNDKIELLITLDVGPRIIRLAPLGGDNVFKEYQEQLGQSGETSWKIRGGHRFWISPESSESGYTYATDNEAVSYEELGDNRLLFHSAANRKDGWEKELEVHLHASEGQVTLTHRIRALQDLDYDIAPWGLSVMAPGGLAILPQAPLGTHPKDLQPNRRLILWPYTDLQDSRYHWGHPNILVQQRPEQGPTKFGFLHQSKWVGYQLGDTLFAKSISYQEGADYPDLGVNFELFSNQDMLELESVAPLCRLHKGQICEHHETWILQKITSPDWKKKSLLDLLPT
jgi:hypothetical protein